MKDKTAPNKKKMALALSLIAIAVGATAMFFAKTDGGENSFEAKRAGVLKQLNLAIEQAKTDGKYKCCIEPPCTMCYLGEWIWEDGTCDCDAMIKQGEWDKVCPQCVKGIEEGRCESGSGICPADTPGNTKKVGIWSNKT